MRVITSLFCLLLVACSASEPETHTMSADVDLVAIPAMLAAMDSITDDELPIDELRALTNSVPMDEEKQQRFTVSFAGAETELLYHVWREQSDWVHVYASSASPELVMALKMTIKPFERSANE